jgi:hypothetical protein
MAATAGPSHLQHRYPATVRRRDRGFPRHIRPTQSPVTKPTPSSTAIILRWSLPIHPSGLSQRGGLKQRTSITRRLEGDARNGLKQR